MYRLKSNCVSGITLETKDTVMRTPTLILHHTHIHTQGNNKSNKRHLKPHAYVLEGQNLEKSSLNVPVLLQKQQK